MSQLNVDVVQRVFGSMGALDVVTILAPIGILVLAGFLFDWEISRFRRRDLRQCPRCGRESSPGVLECPACGFDFQGEGQ